jgi:hypothetical protein
MMSIALRQKFYCYLYLLNGGNNFVGIGSAGEADMVCIAERVATHEGYMGYFKQEVC